MADKVIKVNLQFNANTQNARTQLQNLQNQLTSIINTNTTSSLSITPQIQEATRSAMDLKIALNNATNVNTGKLNLNKFQSELNRSGKSIQQYAQQLKALGPEGVRAFSQLASAIAQADTKLFSLQGGMKKLADTFMNTMRWQLTSQAIKAVTSAVSDTVNYAKELDTSLNNIRIVTGKSSKEMALFAKQANNAAKSLSTSTTKYTDASLIYYQQGLGDKEVKERTDVTVKLANVVGENAETVSEWMTAIWNNFDNGSESLEYYADVLAKLGAATASSADEIAGGLEKFAAVADTIGLSYDYAASALATITAETRQSEDVVGTALKTILSRMEQLKLGETLDDGTTLGQYSLALQTIGVNIKDTNDELKDMDIILQQTGNRWQTLNRDEQIALAQSVAGIRQYTQFMALMDNWDVMEKNLELAKGANGALQEQQKIYEEGTRAAEERLKASGEAIKSTILGGDDLIPLFNFASGVLEIANELLEAFGGLPTILLGVAAALTKVYQPQIANFMSQMVVAGKDMFTTFKHPIQALKGEIPSQSIKFKNQVIDESLKMTSSIGNAPGEASLNSAIYKAQKDMLIQSSSMTENAKQRAQWELQTLQAMKEEVVAASQVAEENQQAVQVRRLDQESHISDAYGGKAQKYFNTYMDQSQSAGKIDARLGIMSATVGNDKNLKLDTTGKQQIGQILQKQIGNVSKAAQELDIKLDNIDGFEKLTKQIETFADKGEGEIKDLINLLNEFKANLNNDIEEKLNTTLSQYEEEIAGDVSKEKAILAGNRVSNKITQANLSTSANTIDLGGTQTETLLDSLGKTKNLDTNQKNQIDNWKKQVQAIKDGNKPIAQMKKEMAALNREIINSTKATKKKTGIFNKDTAATDKANKVLNKRKKLVKDEVENVQKLQNENREGAKASEANAAATDELIEKTEEFNEKVNSKGFSHWSDTLASGINGIASYAMGLSMLTSSFENLFGAIGRGDATWKDWVSSISSAMMSMTMLIPVISQGTSWINKLTKSKHQQKIIDKTLVDLTNQQIKSDEAALIIDKLEHGASEQEIKDEYKEAGAKVINALAKNSQNAGTPATWPAYVAGLAMIAPIAILAGVSAFGGAKGGAKEAKQEEVSKGMEALEAIEENQELATSINDSVKEYDKLRKSGESTADILEDMKEKIPQLIDNYKELAKTMGTHIDTSELEKAYEVFLATGDISYFEKAQEKLDEDIKSKEKSTADTTAQKATELMIDSARKGRGWLDGNTYRIDLGEPNKQINKELEKIFGKDVWDGDNIKFDATNSAAVLNYYEKAIKARDRLKELGYEDSTTYKRLADDIKEMSENAEHAYTAQETLFEIQKEEALAVEKSFNAKAGLKTISSLTEYTDKNRKSMIDALVATQKWTEEQAAAYLAASKTYGAFEQTYQFFKDNNIVFGVKLSDTDKEKVKEEINAIKAWFSELSPEDRSFAMNIDFTIVNSLEDAEKQLKKKKAEAAAADRKQKEQERLSRQREIRSIEKEIDRYHEIKALIDDVSNATDRLAKAKDRAYGKEKLALMQKEIDAYDVQIQAQEKLLKQANHYLQIDKKRLAAFGVQFDALGNISNYSQIEHQLSKRVANIIAKSGSDADKEKAEKRLSDFKDYASQYEKTLEEIEKATEEKVNLINEQLDLRLEEIEYTIEIKVEINDLQLQRLERQLKELKDEAFEGAERVIVLQQQINTQYSNKNAATQGITEILTTAGANSSLIQKYLSGQINAQDLSGLSLTADMVEQLTSFTNDAISAQEEIEDSYEEIKETLMATFEAWHEEMESVSEGLETQLSILESYNTIIDLMGQKRLGLTDKNLKDLEVATQKAAIAQVYSARAQKEFTQQSLDNVREQLAKYKEGSEAYKYWADQEKELDKQLLEDTQEFQDAWVSAVEQAYTIFETQTERALENFSDNLAGSLKSLEELSDMFAKQQQLGERYLDSFDQAYELNKMNRNLEKDLAKYDSVGAQKKLLEFQKEIQAYQKSGEKMTQHEVEMMQRRYDLKLAEIALEEAQNAKSVVRLSRDSEGNFGYIYTADQSAITDAEQNYEDRLYQYKQSNDEYLDQLQEQIVSNRQEMSDKIAELNIADFANTEEYLSAIDKIKKEYLDNENFYLGEIQKTLNNNRTVYNNDVKNYKGLQSSHNLISNKWVTEFNETSLSIITGWKSIEDVINNFEQSLGDPEQGTGYLGGINSALNTLGININETFGENGASKDITDFAAIVDSTINGKEGVVSDIEILRAKVEEYKNKGNQYFDENASKVESWYDTSFGPKVQKGKKDVDNLLLSLSQLKNDINIKVNTDVSGKNQVDELARAIEGVKDAVRDLTNHSFEVTAKVKIETEGEIKDNNKSINVWTKTDTHLKSGSSFEALAEPTDDSFTTYLYRRTNGDYILDGSISRTFENRDLNNLEWEIANSQIYERNGIKYILAKAKETDKNNGIYEDQEWLIPMYNVNDWGTINYLFRKQSASSKLVRHFDTGGYTGQWGPEGRLAMLHQKEIVLNAHDTENFLTAINIVRDISDQLEKNAIAMGYQNALANYRAAISTGGESLEQNITIHAEFPNATDHTEIEEAFRNLTNLASQYANRK